MSNILGISCGFHDAGVSVINRQGDILFASHSERYSKIKHDANLNTEILKTASSYGLIDTVAYYENHWLKKLRQFRAGQPIDKTLTLRGILKPQFGSFDYLLNNNVVSFGHHKSHAAAGFQTSPFDDATVVVIDAIGELDTISIWDAHYDNEGSARHTLLYRNRYPHSIGLFYSAFTQRVGLKPLDEEYIMMGMAAYGKPILKPTIHDELVESMQPLRLKKNMHIGIDDWSINANDVDIAASVQELTESMINKTMQKAAEIGKSRNLVYMGGVALNCLANRHLGEYFDKTWIMPNPGDAGSSLGAAALAYGKKLNWENAFLGETIAGKYPVGDLMKELLENQIVGVASGRAEFGPRALGNRSLLADPRGKLIKDKVNDIKRRQRFRPFAPVILEEHVSSYFLMPTGFKESPYMQVVARCKRPQDFPAIIHADGTSRVQTVPRDGSGIRELLEAWYKETGCPMLLNTSLNIRGEPTVNTRQDAKRFELEYGVKVCT